MILVSIDFQERLCPHISGIDEILFNSRKLIKSFNVLGFPVISTEQVKLGRTVDEIAEVLESEPIQKVSFSCCGSEEFVRKLQSFGEKYCVLIGIETHICVLQTALDLLDMGYDVSVAVDCTGSRREIDKEVALRRMEKKGVDLTTWETIVYEILRTAEHDKFKDILGIVKEKR